MIESIMPIVMLIIIVAVSSAVSKQKAAMQRSRQGQGAAPMPPAPPQAVDEPDDMDEPDEAEEQMSFFDGVLDESDYARTDLSEGESRECDHGSLGGSMDITTHMGQGEDYEPAHAQVAAQARTDQSDDEPAPMMGVARLTAQDMRRAVVMAEILKRPAQRYGRR